ncbi:MAG: hypothetical protein JNJ54_13440 [Myxococcaceae bacterium]|nr:hypothetical protein [Myxococcaceae bacterium]
MPRAALLLVISLLSLGSCKKKAAWPAEALEGEKTACAATNRLGAEWCRCFYDALAAQVDWLDYSAARNGGPKTKAQEDVEKTAFYTCGLAQP